MTDTKKDTAPSVATVDTPEFKERVEAWAGKYHSSLRMVREGWQEQWSKLIAHIDAHVAAQVAAKDAEIKTLKAALDAQGELTDRYQEIALSAQAAPVVSSMKWVSVEDELPDVETDVLVRGKRGDSVCHDVAGLFCGAWQSQGSGDFIRFMVTHWMPIPSMAASTSQPSPAPVAMTDEKERELFEQSERESDLSMDSDGDYANPCVQSAWEGWKARAILAAQQEAV